MAAEAWRRIEATFEEVAALPVEERSKRLDLLCGDDLELRREVEALLAADRQAGDFLESPAVSVNAPSSWIGRQLGAYRIERKLGEGGMGTVYLAARADQEYEAQVAIKVFAHGADQEDLLQRFRAERQILASLDHPGIARLLDGGTTPDGLPYLVMERIDGLAVDRFCDERRLTIDERADLFLVVCEAVAYAHRNLVVHRDLKPSNILVTADGSPRLLDFGIAKLLEGAAVSLPQATLTAQRLMTPHFASPEQIAGGAITTVSDVYALGVLLYLLLTGGLPYRFDPQRLGALEQAVVEQEPIRPSLAVQDPRSSRKLAGDLDNIVLMALAKEPQRRYSSVEALAQDLQRYRQGRPVMARAATAGYRLRKFVARHRLGVAAAGATSAVVLGLAATMTVQAVSLARRSEEIRRERDKAVQVTRFLQEMFRSPDPSQARGEKVTAREILDVGAARIRTELADQPATQAALMNTMGAVYHNLGLDDRARPLLERSLKMRERRLREAPLEVAESLEAVGQFHLERGEPEEAEATFRRALNIRRAAQAGQAPSVARGLNGLGMAMMVKGQFDSAEPLLRQALAIDRATAASQPREETAESLAHLALIRDNRGDPAEAEALYREALRILRRIHGETHPLTANVLNNLGVLLVKTGSFDAAEEFQRESLAVARRVYGDGHLEIAMRLHNLSFLYTERGEPRKAEPLGREALARLRKLLGDENPKVAICLNTLGRALEEKGDLAAAQQSYVEAVRIHRTASGARHPLLARTLANLAQLRGERGDPKAGEALAREALAIQRETIGPAHPDFGSSLVVLGSVRLAQGDPAGAEPLLRQGRDVLAKALPAGHWRIADAQSHLGEALARLRRGAEAEPLLVAGYGLLAKTHEATSYTTTAALRRLVRFYEERGDSRRAAWYRSKLPG